MLDSSYQGLKRLFVFAYDNTAGDDRVSVDSENQKLQHWNWWGKNFMISQLMTQLSNTTKSEKYQQDKVMIIQQAVYWILLIVKKIRD